MKAIGLYIHIPFCKSKCIYCDFNSQASGFSKVAEYIEVLIEEIKYYSKEVGQRPVRTIYFGGGTPSVIESLYIEKILNSIYDSYNVSSVEEITIEANPGTVDEKQLKSYLKMGINRISFGVQSFDESVLKFLGRAHSSKEAKQAVALSKKVGFNNISLDLIFSLPGQTTDMIEKDLQIVAGLDIQHVSTYSLKYEEGTPLYKMMEDGLVDVVDDETDRRHSEYVNERLNEMGFLQYEISNYSKEGFESKHNSSYWTMDEYIGLGLGASSFYMGDRYNNEEKLSKYLSISPEHLKKNVSKLSEDDYIFEYIMLGLRLNVGIDLAIISNRYNRVLMDEFAGVLEELIKLQLIEVVGTHVSLTDLGRDLSNQVFLKFLNEL